MARRSALAVVDDLHVRDRLDRDVALSPKRS
jgi:hypothetical protein